MGKSGKILFAAGLAAVLLLAAPGLLLGENAIITYHDQLDGEMIAYILQAKHLWQGGGLPEFMGGAGKTALIPPAPGCVLLFLGGDYLAAFWMMQLVGSLTGYVGMYLLAREVTGRDLPGVWAGGLYACVPFLPVYGLSQYGLPMLLWCVLQLRRGRRLKGALLYALLYALHSSLVLAGFGVLLALAAGIALEAQQTRGRMCGEPDRRRVLRLSGMWLVLALGYLATNLSLIGQVLGLGEAAVSHKAEYALAPEAFRAGWLDGFLYGGQHSQDYHLGILAAALVTLALSFGGSGGNPRETKLRKAIIHALCANLTLAGIAALWNSGAGVAFRSHLGSMGAFQLDRLLWLAPCLWYLMLACVLALIPGIWRGQGRFHKMRAGICAAAAVAAVCACGLQIFINSDVKANVQKLRNADYPAMSYADYYAIGVLEQVKAFLGEHTGLEQSQYRVVSLGIDPAAALYHGFYCLDGYSNNYDLAYKRRFREVIAPALEASDYLRDYFDEWGNRCYLFGSECPGYYTIEKNGFYFAHLELDTEALRGMGGNYLFSAAYIANAQELGLTLLREEPFETKESYYRIFLYEIERP